MARRHPRGAQLLRSLSSSFAISLATFVWFKLLGFYTIPAGLVLGFLLTAHPLGVVWGGKRFGADVRAASTMLAGVTAVTVLGWTVAGAFLPGSFHLPSQQGLTFYLLVHVLGVGALLVPFFFLAGAVEYAIIAAAHHEDEDLRSWAYAGILFSTLMGIAVGYASIALLGVLPLLAASITAATFATERRRGTMAALVVTLGLAVVGLAVPSVDRMTVRAMTPRGEGSPSRGEVDHMTTELSEWGRYSYVDVLTSESGRTTAHYNGAPYWSTYRPGSETDDSQLDIDALVVDLVPDAGAIAIIGGGGGKQLLTIRDAGRDIRTDAFELEPSVVRFFTGSGAALNGGLYLDENVTSHAMEGRAGVRAAHAPYDAIYVADAGNFFNYLRTILDFSAFLHTTDAYREYASHLSEGGVLASLIMNNLDFGVSQRVVNVMEAAGLRAAVVRGEQFTLIVGSRPEAFDRNLEALTAAAARRGFSAPELGRTALDLPNAVPTDDRGAVYLFSIYPEPAVRGFVIASLLIALVLIAFAARARPIGPHALPRMRRILLIAIGINFVWLENAVILEITKVTLNVSDAVILGSALVLGAGAVGAAISRIWRARPGTALAVVLTLSSSLVLAIDQPAVPVAITAGLAVALIVINGAYFPLALHDCAGEGTRAAFALDSLGSAIGAVTVFFVPALLGIRAVVVIAILLSVVVGLILFVGRRRSERASSTRTPPSNEALPTA